MLTANNGILIVALTMALGVYANNKWLMVLAFAMAGLSYFVNWIDGMQFDTPGSRALRTLLSFGAISAGFLAYVQAANILLLQ